MTGFNHMPYPLALVFKNLDYALYGNWYHYGEAKWVWDVAPMEELLPGMRFEELLDPMLGAMELAVSMDELGFFDEFKKENKMMRGGFDSLNGFSPTIFTVSALRYVKRLALGS